MTADAILAELPTDSARTAPYPALPDSRELGPITPLTETVAGATPFAAVATGHGLAVAAAQVEPAASFLRGMNSVPVTLS